MNNFSAGLGRMGRATAVDRPRREAGPGAGAASGRPPRRQAAVVNDAGRDDGAMIRVLEDSVGARWREEESDAAR